MTSINNGSDTATIFFLKTRGKSRGYIDKQEVQHSGDVGITWKEEKTYIKDDANI